ncbi:MAG: restriction endonuclease [Phycisphaerales bacterium]
MTLASEPQPQLGRRIFIAGAMATHELDADREIARLAINSLSPHFHAFAFKAFADGPWETIAQTVSREGGQREIAQSRAMLCLIGSTISSFCIQEYKFARKLGMPCVIFARKTGQRSDKLSRFLRDCRSPIVEYANPYTDLADALQSYCNALLEQEPEKNLAASRTIRFWDELVSELAKEPELAFAMTPREFEELVAGIISSFGHEVELTPRSHDEGRDVIVRRTNDPLFPTRHLVQVKLWRNDIGRSTVDEMIGVGERERCNSVMLVTPSSFKDQPLQLVSRANLDDYVHFVDGNDLPDWYNTYLSRRGQE